MKSVITSIKEAANKVSDTVENLGFTQDELINDYKEAENATGTEKKALIAKYKSPSAKKGDIQKIILLQMRELRKTKKNFDEEDVRWFIRLSDMPSRYKNLCEWLDKESSEFVVYLKNYYEDKLKKTSYRGDKSLFDVKSLAKGRDWNYSITMAQKTSIDRYNNFCQYLVDNDPEVMKDKASQEDILQSIILKLMEQMKDFKESYLDRVKKQTEDLIDSAPKMMEEYKEKSKKMEIELQNLSKEAREKGTSSYRYAPYIELDKKHSKISSVYLFYRKLTKVNKAQYVADEVKHASEAFDSNVRNLADKIKEKGLIVPDMTISNIGHDPKIFQMLITDGKQKLYARSIIAAEYSEKVTTHYRFIITNRPV